MNPLEAQQLRADNLVRSWRRDDTHLAEEDENEFRDDEDAQPEEHAIGVKNAFQLLLESTDTAESNAIVAQIEKLIEKDPSAAGSAIVLGVLDEAKKVLADATKSKIHPQIQKVITAIESNATGGRRKSRRSHKLRLNVKRRRTQRNGRSRKHRKLRKLATRRR